MNVMQKERPVAVETNLGTDVLVFRRMSGTEQLGRLFEFQLDLLSEVVIRLEDVVGQNMTIRVDLPDGSPRYFNGFVSHFSDVGPSGKLCGYKATLRPWLWFLTRSADCRIFQEKTALQIIKQIFDEHGFTDYLDRTTESYRTWEYLVQYRETDFNFVSRVMEQEGMYYYVTHENGKHNIVLADSYSSHDPLPGYETVPFHAPFGGGLPERDYITEWRVVQEAQTGTYVLNDWNFETPGQPLTAVLSKPKDHAVSGMEIFDYPGEYQETSDGENYAKLRLEELHARFEQVHGWGDVRGLYPGGLFKLDGHPREDQDREYLLLSTNYEIESDDYEGSGRSGGFSYSCGFTAMAPDGGLISYRAPRVTPKPVVQGPQTAIVVGPSGEEIYTNEHGEVKVQFHWDREGKADQDSSCWMRVSSGWAGKQWGQISLPRIGQEVIVDFLEGDPDRPIITGRVYNADAKPPYPLPEHKTRSTVKSNSSKGGGGFNEFRFEDKKGKEQIFMHGERNLDIRIKNNAFRNIGNEDHCIVGNNQYEEVGYGENAEGNKHLKVFCDQIEMIEGNVSQTVVCDRMVSVEGSDSLTVGGDRYIDVTGDNNLKVVGNHNHGIDGTYSVGAGMDIHEKAGMNMAVEGGMNVHMKGGMNVVVEAGLQLTLKGPGGFITIGPAGVDIQGMMVKINSGGAAGAGAGCSPTDPMSPTMPDEPIEPTPADDAKPGGVSEVSRSPGEQTPSELSSVEIGEYENPQAQTLSNAAQDGAPFCEECEKARQAAAGGGESSSATPGSQRGPS